MLEIGLRKLHERHGITRREVARRVGVSRTTLYRAMWGEATPQMYRHVWAGIEAIEGVAGAVSVYDPGGENAAI